MSEPSDPRNWSDEGASYAGAQAIEPTRLSKRNRLLRALEITSLSTAQIHEIAGGEGTRRLRELRQLGWVIVSHPIKGSPQRLYTLMGKTGESD